jgi:ABC-type phosphate transport system permease subunit
VCTRLQAEMQAAHNGAGANNVRWQLVEAILFTAQCIGQQINGPGESSVLFSQLISFVPTLPHLPGLALTIIDLIGRSSNWLRSNTQVLPTLMPHLLASLSNALISTFEDTVLMVLFVLKLTVLNCVYAGERAAKAIMNIFKACADAPELPTQEIFDIMIALR